MDLKKPEYYYRVAEVYKVIDGDTFDLAIDVGFYTTIRKRIRLIESDTYEVRGGTTETKTKGLAAKARAEELFKQAKNIYIKTEMDAQGKYGRLLAWVFVEDHDGTIVEINDVMLAEGFVESSAGS